MKIQMPFCVDLETREVFIFEICECEGCAAP